MLVLQQTETKTRILFRQVPVLHIQHLGVCIAAFTAAVALSASDVPLLHLQRGQTILLHLRHNVIAFAMIAAFQIALLRLCQLLRLQHRLCRVGLLRLQHALQCADFAAPQASD